MSSDVDPRDLLGIEDLLSKSERSSRDGIRTFVADAVLPHVDGWYERGEFPTEMAREAGKRGLLGMHLEGYGCPGRSAVEYGLACLELEAGDSGMRSFVSVQGSLAMFAIHRYGSEEQKETWLPRMAAGEAVGCFGLTEPTAGSDPSAMKVTASRDGEDWVLSGTKRWSTNGTFADVAVVWARTDDGVRGFVVPTDTDGFRAEAIEGKLSLRASASAQLFFDDVRLPESARLPEARGLGAPLSCLNEARYGVLWGALGAGRACFEAALDRATTREQFGKPIGAFQLTQLKLVEMVTELQKGLLLALHLGRRKDAGTLTHEQVSVGKLNNCREALHVAHTARSILGAEGVTDAFPVMRHAANLESVLTYEGTQEMHTLVVGHALTGLRAFN